MKIRILVPVALTMLLSACAQVPSTTSEHVPDQQKWQTHIDQISQLRSWKLKGRLSITTPNESWTATMHWQQIDDSYQIRFIAPFGKGTYELQGNDDIVMIRTAQNEQYQARTPEELLSRNMGWEINLAGLTYWIRGIPDPNESTDQLSLNNDDLLLSLEQHGFKINVIRYQDVEGRFLPGKIFVNNDNIKLKMIIRTWEI